MDAYEQSANADAELRRLIGSCAAGDRDAMSPLMDRSWSLVYRMCALVLRDRTRAERCATSTYLKIWNRAPTFNSTSGSPRSWLATIAYNQARAARSAG